ncbi:MAG: deoxyribonuclease IV, partial [Patescibacteria group bacterium]
ADTPIIGAHISGGLTTCVENAEKIGARAMQIFGSSPRMWRTRMPLTGEVAEYKKVLAKSSVKAVYLHAAYLVNLASSSTEIYTYSMQSLMDHLKIAEVIGAEGVIFHLGSTKGGTREEGFAREIEAMKKVLQAVPGKAQLIMENTAGGGDKIGAEIVDIERLMHGVNSPRVKVCYDTAHGFEAGLVESYTQASVKKLFDEFDKELGVENIVAIHANDSKTISGSNHDQHENIGDGHIGIEGFKALAGEKRLYNKAWLLEVPGFLGEGPDEENIKLLTSCFK